MSGPSIALDPAIHAYRSDIADIALAGQLIASHYARPVIRHAVAGAILREQPRADGGRIADLGPGEAFAVLDISGGWTWGYRCSDHRVGYVPADALTG